MTNFRSNQISLKKDDISFTQLLEGQMSPGYKLPGIRIPINLALANHSKDGDT